MDGSERRGSLYGKSTETAIAAVSRLAEVWDGGNTRLSAADIADQRGLQRPFVAKVLSALAQADLVSSVRGPGGGFILARPPAEIRLYDVFIIFERAEATETCPFGGGRCGSADGANCPLHDRLSAVHNAIDDVLHNTTFDVFRQAASERTTPLTASVEAH